MNFNYKSKKNNTYDAIVIGTRISAGWAAKELNESGLNTLVLERERDVKHIEDYPTMLKEPWEISNNDQFLAEEAKHYEERCREMLEATGLKNTTKFDDPGGPGLDIHEMGTARMGRDPKTSVLNRWNQVHSVKNVFVTDGACMSSAACQNPSLMYMALTARAANYASDELQKGNL